MKTIMLFSAVTLLLFAIVVVLLLIRLVCRLRFVELEKAWLPRELQGAALVYAEQVFRARSPVPIIAKLDRGYRDVNDVIILVELKTRHVNRPYLSDVIELSVQRLAVQAQTGERIADYGYVVIQRAGRKRKNVHRVELLTPAQVVELVARREVILTGETEASYTRWPGLCAHCGFRQQCKPPASAPENNVDK